MQGGDMPRPTTHCIVATHRISEEEYFQMSVPLISGYPDAMDQAKSAAVDGIRRMFTDAMQIMFECESDAEGS